MSGAGERYGKASTPTTMQQRQTNQRVIMGFKRQMGLGQKENSRPQLGNCCLAKAPKEAKEEELLGFWAIRTSSSNARARLGAKHQPQQLDRFAELRAAAAGPTDTAALRLHFFMSSTLRPLRFLRESHFAIGDSFNSKYWMLSGPPAL